MQQAGQAAARAALSMLAGRPGPVLVLAGPGNNGGDALEVAAHLAHAQREVTIVQLEPRHASAERDAARGRAANSRAAWCGHIDTEKPWALAIDGLFGIGLARPPESPARELVAQVNALGCPVLALDIPSGLDADTGTVKGCAVKATTTITFLGNKPGLHTADGRDYAGEVLVDWLGVDSTAVPAPAALLNTPQLFMHHLAARRQNSHKGSFGDVAVLGGAEGMLGAVLLASRMALYAGAGRIYAGTLAAGLPVDVTQPELMWRDAATVALKRRTLVAGPGMGTSDAASALLARALDADGPAVLDADALNLIAADSGLQHRLAARAAPAILTPHPLEAARLLGITVQAVQAQRLACARDIAARLACTVILKGSGSIIAAPGQTPCINPTGNPALATGGTGDVLAGLAGALLAQGVPAWEAACAAAWMHGKAADDLVAEGVGPIGATASELIPAIRRVRNRIGSVQAQAQS